MIDLISNSSSTPSFEDIGNYIYPPVREIWQELNSFIQERFKSAPKIQYSTCAGKPGWNVKYQKSGKSICTLYPERECFIALVVIRLDLIPLVEGAQEPFHPLILDMVRNSKPFNNTLWLMIPVAETAMLHSVEELLALKASVK